MTLTQKAFQAQAGDRAVIWINPTNVALHTGTKWPVGKHRLAQLQKMLPKSFVKPLRPWLKRREPFVIPKAHFGEAMPVEQTGRHILVSDFIANMDNPTTSLWYRDLTDDLARTGVARHKQIEMRSDAEIRDFLRDYVAALITSLQTDGYADPQGGFESTAVINADGALCKAGSGNHRFNMAHALGLDRFPLRIAGIHEDWFRAQSDRIDVAAALSLIHAAENSHR